MKMFLFFLPLLLASGCATTPRPAPVPQADVISMTKAGLSDDEIIQRLAISGTVYRLSSDDVVRLRNEGVRDRVVNYMLDTYARALVEEQRRRDYYEMRWHYGIYYGRPWYW